MNHATFPSLRSMRRFLSAGAASPAGSFSRQTRAHSLAVGLIRAFYVVLLFGAANLDERRYPEPERFDLKYAAADGKEERPVMIHRAMFGSLERFIGVMIEHFGGALPLWLAPVQTALLPVTERANAYAREILALLDERGFRVAIDDRNEKIGAKIRDAQLRKVPFMLILGDREATENTVAVRSRRGGDEGAISLEAFLEKAQAVASSKSNDV